ncbi:chromate efflux transporter [Simiduia curdlanivorans]|uniref:Chromate efflux transporter n=1 Tax=Simiduia curdlanivorans TaxID=1492769 RepID=A0ABV8V0X2_9GAMM|nr:chromate efflux transporter [Simiduia curdlanivorans]MDN3637824.1 chromate efflux transporter [Simiduia curdlanivorans]
MIDQTPARAESVSRLEAFYYWLKLGFISFGGPAGQISMMHQELVEKRRWISEHRFLHALNYTMVLPGPEAQQLATYIGWLMHGVWGGILAGVLFVLPSFFMLVALTWVYLAYGDLAWVAAILYGVKPAVTAIVVFAAYRIGVRALKNNALRLMALLAFMALFFFNLPFPYIVIGAGIIGFLGGKLAPETFRLGAARVATLQPLGAALIDDDTPIPGHAVFKLRKAVLILLSSLALWCIALAALIAWQGADSVLVDMASFFTKAAFVTFGGAYAVLPYVHQGGVETYAWLTTAQMMDGLALGETTPGPLIMVVAFVGFVGGWTKAIFGAALLPLAGLVAAGVVTFFTFLPSFLFILLGGPAVEASRDEVAFTAPLTGISAAVVGVIVNLAAFFAMHVFWPQGMAADFDGLSLLIALGAFVAMWRWNLGVVPVIFASALAGAASLLLA